MGLRCVPQSSLCAVSVDEADILGVRRPEEVMVELVSEGFVATRESLLLRDPKDVLRRLLSSVFT